MERGFIDSHIRRGGRRTLIFGLALVVGGGGLALAFDSWGPWIVSAVGVVVLFPVIRPLIDSSSSPVYKRLARYGNASQLAQQVDREFAGMKADDSTQLGATWLAQGGMHGSVLLVPWLEMAWLHLYTESHNGIPSHFVRVWERDGTSSDLPVGRKPEPAETLLRDLHARAPWAEIGYTPEVEQQWTKARPEFLSRVDARKQ